MNRNEAILAALGFGIVLWWYGRRGSPQPSINNVGDISSSPDLSTHGLTGDELLGALKTVFPATLPPKYPSEGFLYTRNAKGLVTNFPAQSLFSGSVFTGLDGQQFWWSPSPDPLAPLPLQG